MRLSRVDIAGVGRLVGEGDRVLVRGIQRGVGQHDSLLGKLVLQAREQSFGFVAAALVENAGEGLDPLLLLEFPVGRGLHQLRFRQDPCFPCLSLSP